MVKENNKKWTKNTSTPSSSSFFFYNNCYYSYSILTTTTTTARQHILPYDRPFVKKHGKGFIFRNVKRKSVEFIWQSKENDESFSSIILLFFFFFFSFFFFSFELALLTNLGSASAWMLCSYDNASKRFTGANQTQPGASKWSTRENPWHYYTIIW